MKLTTLAALVGFGFAIAATPSVAAEHEPWRHFPEAPPAMTALVAGIIKSEAAGLATEAYCPSCLYVRFNTDPWALTKGTRRMAFLALVRGLVPAVFEAFPEVDEISIDGVASYVDIRGHQKSRTAMGVLFTRENAATINWRDVLSENIPRIADSSSVPEE